MGTRTIRARDEVYQRLKARKRPDESFSDLLDRLTDRDDQFDRGFGALADVDFEGAIEALDDHLADAFLAGR